MNYQSQKAYRKKSSYDTFPSVSITVAKDIFSMKLCLTSDKNDWTKPNQPIQQSEISH
jgi:hypothetical protein